MEYKVVQLGIRGIVYTVVGALGGAILGAAYAFEQAARKG